VGLGTELLLVLLLGFLILGPAQMHALMRRLAQAKTKFDKATRTFKSKLKLEPETPARDHEPPLA
jgi:Sec-independent protein translocase protein TatA